MADVLKKDPETYERECDSFLRDLKQFHETRGTPFKKPPHINGKELDLYLLYALVTAKGGWIKVNSRNEWNVILQNFQVPKNCVNNEVALKQIYLRYLDRYEKIHFLGETVDRGSDDDEDSRHKKWSAKSMHSVPLTYNYHQHVVPDNVRSTSNLSVDVYKPSDYDKLALSLISPLPNEQDFAINTCALLCGIHGPSTSAEGKSTPVLQLGQHPRLIHYLLGHAAVFNHPSLRKFMESTYKGSRGYSMKYFWADVLEDKELAILTDEKKFVKRRLKKQREKLLLASCRRYTRDRSPSEASSSSESEQEKSQFFQYGSHHEDKLKIEPEDSELFCLRRSYGTQDIYGQRVLQIATILRNATFMEENVAILANNLSFMRFVLLCCGSRWNSLHQLGFDMLTNVAPELVLENSVTDHLVRVVSKGLESEDRAIVLACVETVNKLGQKEENEDVILRCFDRKVYERICSFLTLHDIMLLIQTLECLYSLSNLGERACNNIVHVQGAIHTLVSLVTVEAQSYGPKACILMRVVETITNGESESDSVPSASSSSAVVSSSVSLASTAAAAAVSVITSSISNTVYSSSIITSGVMSASPSSLSSVVSSNATEISFNVTPVVQAVSVTSSAGVITPHATVAYSQKQSGNQQKGVGVSVITSAVSTAMNSIGTTPRSLSPSTSQTQQAPILTTEQQDNENFAMQWLRTIFEAHPTPGRGIEQGELYKQYLNACARVGRKGVVSPTHFPQCVKAVFGNNVGPRQVIASKVGMESTASKIYVYEGIQVRSKPMHIATSSVASTNSSNSSSSSGSFPSSSSSLQQQQQNIRSPSSPILKAQLSSPTLPTNVVKKETTKGKVSSSHPHLSNVLLGTSSPAAATVTSSSKTASVITQVQSTNVLVSPIAQTSASSSSTSASSGVQQQDTNSSSGCVINNSNTSLIKSLLANKVGDIIGTSKSAVLVNRNGTAAADSTIQTHRPQFVINTSAVTVPITQNQQQVTQRQQQQQQQLVQGSLSQSQPQVISQSPSQLQQQLLQPPQQTLQQQNVSSRKECPKQQQKIVQATQMQQQMIQKSATMQQQLITQDIEKLLPKLATVQKKVDASTATVTGVVTATSTATVTPNKTTTLTLTEQIRQLLQNQQKFGQCQPQQKSVVTQHVQTIQHTQFQSQSLPIAQHTQMQSQAQVRTQAETQTPQVRSQPSVIQRQGTQKQTDLCQEVSVITSAISLQGSCGQKPPFLTRINGLRNFQNVGVVTMAEKQTTTEDTPMIGSPATSMCTELDENFSPDAVSGIMGPNNGPLTLEVGPMNSDAHLIAGKNVKVELDASLPMQETDSMGLSDDNVPSELYDDYLINGITGGNIKYENENSLSENLLMTDDSLLNNIMMEDQLAANIMADGSLLNSLTAGDGMDLNLIKEEPEDPLDTGPEIKVEQGLQTEPYLDPNFINVGNTAQIVKNELEPKVIKQETSTSKCNMLAELLEKQVQKKEPPILNGALRFSEKGLELVMTRDEGGTIKQERSVICTNKKGPVGINKYPAAAMTTTAIIDHNRADSSVSKCASQNEKVIVGIKRTNDQEVQCDQVFKKPHVMNGDANIGVGVAFEEEVTDECNVKASSSAANLYAALAADVLGDIDPLDDEEQLASHLQTQSQSQSSQTQTVPQQPTVHVQQQVPQQQQQHQHQHQPMVIEQQPQQLYLATAPGNSSRQILALTAGHASALSSLMGAPGQQLIVSPQTAIIQGQPQTVLVTQTAQQHGTAAKTIIILSPQTPSQISAPSMQTSKLINKTQTPQPSPTATSNLTTNMRQAYSKVTASNVPPNNQTQKYGQSQTTQFVQSQQVSTSQSTPTNRTVQSNAVSQVNQQQLVSSAPTSSSVTNTVSTTTVRTSVSTPNPNTQSKQVKVIKSGPSSSATTRTSQRSLPEQIQYLCEWRSCMRSFKTASEVYLHACAAHCPSGSQEIQCLWERCDAMKRKRFSLMTHLYDRHCNPEILRMMAVRRRQISQSGRSEIPPPPTPPPHPGYAPNAAYQAIKRHALEFVNPKELQDENEGPVTKSIRLTSSLILRNLVIYSTNGKRCLSSYESHLASVALSNVESSRTIAQLLFDLNEHNR